MKVIPTQRGAGITPACPQCGDSKLVIRMFHGGKKFWVCSLHYRIKSTETTQQTLRQRVLHRKPEEKSFAINEVLPNRAARRAHGRA